MLRRAAVTLLVLAIVALSVAAATAPEKVAYNTKSHIYHCLTCTWAKRCTVNCVDISRGEAIKRGGRACKVCGGWCAVH